MSNKRQVDAKDPVVTELILKVIGDRPVQIAGRIRGIAGCVPVALRGDIRGSAVLHFGNP